jgi:hypothetical protein
MKKGVNKRSKEKKSPYETWSNYYNSNDSKHKSVNTEFAVNDDIHHFYSKSQRPPSIVNHPSFTPHISSKTTSRRSQIGSQRFSMVNKNINEEF